VKSASQEQSTHSRQVKKSGIHNCDVLLKDTYYPTWGRDSREGLGADCRKNPGKILDYIGITTEL